MLWSAGSLAIVIATDMTSLSVEAMLRGYMLWSAVSLAIVMATDMTSLSVEAMLRGYHVDRDIQAACNGEQLCMYVRERLPDHADCGHHIKHGL